MSTSVSPNRWTVSGVLLAAVGTVFVGLAFLGAILPLLPTSPFVLLAGACFVRAWPRADKWLHDHPVFGPFRRMRGGEPAMTRRFKWIAIGVTVATFGTTLLLVEYGTAIRVVLVVLCMAVVWFLARQPVIEPQPEDNPPGDPPA